MRLAAITLLLLVASTARSEEGRVIGVVVDRTGTPLRNAILDLKIDPHTDAANTRPDQNGAFEFPGVKPGSYELVVQAEGFYRAELKNVVVTNGKDTTVPVTMTLRIIDAIYITPAAGFHLGSVNLRSVWTTSRGLPSIPREVIEGAWKEQALSPKTGEPLDHRALFRAGEVIRKIYEKYGSRVRVDREIDDSSAAVAITFRVVELCSCP